MDGKLFIIIPCFNEEACIIDTLKDLRRHVPSAHIVIVNDGSADRTSERLREFDDPDMTVIDLPFNSGIGVAVQTGLIYAARHGADCAVKFDSDGQHPAAAIPAMLAAMDEHDSDLVIGSRFIGHTSGFRSSLMRRAGIRLFRWLCFILTGQAIADATSGFRAYGASALRFAARYYPSFDYPEPEECVLFLRNHLRVLEIPCDMSERRGGRSSIRPLSAVYYMLKVSFAMIIVAMRPRIVRSGE